ncbi:unnamed protein product, partial [Linum tenue]
MKSSLLSSRTVWGMYSSRNIFTNWFQVISRGTTSLSGWRCHQSLAVPWSTWTAMAILSSSLS